METLLWTGFNIMMVGVLIGGLGTVIPIMIGKFEEKWYPTVMHVTVAAGLVLAVEGLTIMVMVYAAIHSIP